MNYKRSIKIIFGLAIVLLVFYFAVPSFAYTSDSYSGEFLHANKVYMPNNNIKLVIYFNGSDTTKFVVFDNWNAKHSIQLSNMNEGSRIEIYYKEYMFGGSREIVRIENL